jgi:predicted transcriptional regulator
LPAIAAAEQRPRAAIIREAIAAYLTQRNPSAADSTFGLWKHRG